MRSFGCLRAAIRSRCANLFFGQRIWIVWIQAAGCWGVVRTSLAIEDEDVAVVARDFDGVARRRPPILPDHEARRLGTKEGRVLYMRLAQPTYLMLRAPAGAQVEELE